MLSVAPSQAVAGTPSLTVAAGNAVAGTSAGAGVSETASAATVTVTGLTDASTDSYVVAVFLKSSPTAADTAIASTGFRIFALDTVTYSNTTIESSSATPDVVTDVLAVDVAGFDSRIVGAGGTRYEIQGGPGYVGAKFGIMVESATSRVGGNGAYVFTVRVTPHNGNTGGTPVEADVTLTVA